MTEPNNTARNNSNELPDFEPTETTAPEPAPETAPEPTRTTDDAPDYTTPTTFPKSNNKGTQDKGRTLAASTWAGLIIGFLLLILLIVFIMQNQQQVPINFLGWSGTFPAGIAYLICTIFGALIMALVGGWRMFELRRQARKK